MCTSAGEPAASSSTARIIQAMGRACLQDIESSGSGKSRGSYEPAALLYIEGESGERSCQPEGIRQLFLDTAVLTQVAPRASNSDRVQFAFSVFEGRV